MYWKAISGGKNLEKEQNKHKCLISQFVLGDQWQLLGRIISSNIYVPHLGGGGHIDFGVDPVGVTLYSLIWVCTVLRYVCLSI